jgi:hypothetical protein
VLPDFIGVDASQLQINEGIHLKDIPKTEGLRFLDDPDHMVVSVAAPMTDAKLESLLATAAPGVEGAKEPEVAAKGKAVAEGAAGAEAGKAGEAKAGAAAPKAGAAPAKKEPEKKKKSHCAFSLDWAIPEPNTPTRGTISAAGSSNGLRRGGPYVSPGRARPSEARVAPVPS